MLSKEIGMNSLIWKMTHSRSWAPTDATVESCQWVRYHDHLGGLAGHYRVDFSYQPADGGQVQHGEFCHEGSPHIAPYAVGEKLRIQYDPRKPARHYFSGAVKSYETLEAIVAVGLFALLAGYFLYAF
jgi:hypothetical protein